MHETSPKTVDPKPLVIGALVMILVGAVTYGATAPGDIDLPPVDLPPTLFSISPASEPALSPVEQPVCWDHSRDSSIRKGSSTLVWTWVLPTN